MRFTYFCATALVAILALTQPADSAIVNQLPADQLEVASPISYSQNDVEVMMKNKGKPKKRSASTGAIPKPKAPTRSRGGSEPSNKKNTDPAWEFLTKEE